MRHTHKSTFTKIASKMWHEARKQEKKIREVMVDFQRRAERRREHYERTRVDPSKYLRIIGTKCPLHLDPTGGKVDTSMIPWQGDTDNMISRYDVRVHLDYIPDYSKTIKEEPSKEERIEENKCNYERYRSMVQNIFSGENESDVLAKLEVEDLFSDIQKSHKTNKKKGNKSKAAIGFDYDEGVGVAGPSSQVEDDEEDINSDDEYKVDLDVDVLATKQIDKLNVIALDYGISHGFFSKSLRAEKSILKERQDARMVEIEKSALSGKKSRKERRIFKDMMLRTRPSTPPLYATRGSPTYEPYETEDKNVISSRSTSPESNDAGTMEFITEFGGGEEKPSVAPTTATKSSSHVTSTDSHVSSHRQSHRRSPSPPRYSRSHDRHNYQSNSRSHSNDRRHRQSRSRDRYRSHDHSPHYTSGRRSRSRSRSPNSVSVITKTKLGSKKMSSSTTKQKSNKMKVTPQERLKRKMQAQLSKTFKYDKKKEKEKAEAKETEELEREEQMREETRKLRERERQRMGGDEDTYRYHRSRSPSPYNYRY